MPGRVLLSMVDGSRRGGALQRKGRQDKNSEQGSPLADELIASLREDVEMLDRQDTP